MRLRAYYLLSSPGDTHAAPVIKKEPREALFLWFDYRRRVTRPEVIAETQCTHLEYYFLLIIYNCHVACD